VKAIAGGGGAGGGGGQYSSGQAATGSPNNSNPYGVNAGYPNGGTNGAWSNILNQYAVWQGNGWYYWKVYFPTTDTYTISASIDNYGSFWIDSTQIMSIGGYQSVYTATPTVTAGWHIVSMYGINTGGPGAVGGIITGPSGTIWTSKATASIGTNGNNGEDEQSDAGGGGGGGGGYIGGTGGIAGVGDVGGTAGANGVNYINNPSHSLPSYGTYGTGTVCGGATDIDYPGGNRAYGGLFPTGNGYNGYAIITFYKKSALFVKKDGVYTSMLSLIHI
jgi:hypothetical protein